MAPIFALFLKTSFDEGEDFLLYRHVSSKYRAQRGDIDCEKLCAPGLRGLYWSCGQVMYVRADVATVTPVSLCLDVWQSMRYV
jgi:hypothetical protein